MKKRITVILSMLLAVCLISACAAEQTGTGETGGTSDVFKLGGTAPLTGGAAIYGNAVERGAELAVEEINALGGVQFELNYQDDEHDAEKAVNAYNALKDWGIQISLSSVTSTPAVAIMPDMFADRVFGLTPSASTTALTEGNDNVFQMCFADPNQGSASAQYIFDQKLGTKVAIIYKNDDVYSSGIYETFMAKAEELGLEVVSETTFTEDSQTDFSVQITDARDNGADLVFLPMYYTPASLIFTQAASAGYEPKFFGVDGMDGILTLEGFDVNLAEGVMLLTPFSADAADEMTVNFVTKYEEKYDEVPNQFAADAYDCVYAVYKAIQESNGTITPDMPASEICEALIGIFTGEFTFDGVTGASMTWNEDGQVSKDPKAVIIQNGVYVGM